jgi:hypothetical protein
METLAMDRKQTGTRSKAAWKRRVLSAALLLVPLICGGHHPGACDAGGQQPESGIVGVVPHHAEDVRRIEGRIDQLRIELASSRSGRASLARALDDSTKTLRQMGRRCVEVFDPESELPTAYPPTIPRGSSAGEFRACQDARSPSGFMREVAASECSDDGSFRLALRPGHYAAFVGQPSAARAAGNSWWRLIDVKPNQWLQMRPPPSLDSPTVSCASDGDCYYGEACRQQVCKPRPRTAPPAFASGVKGRVGLPRNACAGTLMVEPDRQCVGALHSGSKLVVACALCSARESGFMLQLPPGDFILEFSAPDGKQETESIEIAQGQWLDRYVLGARSGPIAWSQCPPVP